MFAILTSSVISVKQALGSSDKLFSNNYMEISLNIPDKDDKSKIIDALTKEQGIILEFQSNFQTEPNSKLITEAIYFNERPYITPEMISGRFFNKDDFKDNNKVCVIGKNYMDKVEKIDGQTYMVFNGEKYKIIGIMGNKNKTDYYDNLLILNLKSYLFSSKDFYNELFAIIQVDNINGNVEDSLANIEKSLAEIDSKINIEIQPNILSSSNTWSAALGRSGQYIVIFFILIIVLLINIINASFFWVENQRKIIGVRKTYGATNGKIISSIIIKFEIITLSSSLLAIIAERILIKYASNFYILQDIDLNTQNYVSTLICLIIFSMMMGLISSLFPVSFMLKQEVNDIIRER